MKPPIHLSGTTVPTIFAVGAVICLWVGYSTGDAGFALAGWGLAGITILVFVLELAFGDRTRRRY